MGENKLYCMRCFEAMEDGSNTLSALRLAITATGENALPYGTLFGENTLWDRAVLTSTARALHTPR